MGFNKNVLYILYYMFHSHNPDIFLLQEHGPPANVNRFDNHFTEYIYLTFVSSAMSNIVESVEYAYWLSVWRCYDSS